LQFLDVGENSGPPDQACVAHHRTDKVLTAEVQGKGDAIFQIMRYVLYPTELLPTYFKNSNLLNSSEDI
jgi:hypothetical protein